MKKCEYKFYEWNVNNCIHEQLILQLIDSYHHSGRDTNESILERMDFLTPNILLSEYYPLTVLPVSVLAAHYGCLLLPGTHVYVRDQLKEIIYDAGLNLFDYISETEIFVYESLRNDEAEAYSISKQKAFFEWFSPRYSALSRLPYARLFRTIIAKVIALIFERRTAPEILCLCLTVY